MLPELYNDRGQITIFCVSSSHTPQLSFDILQEIYSKKNAKWCQYEAGHTCSMTTHKTQIAGGWTFDFSCDMVGRGSCSSFYCTVAQQLKPGEENPFPPPSLVPRSWSCYHTTRLPVDTIASTAHNKTTPKCVSDMKNRPWICRNRCLPPPLLPPTCIQDLCPKMSGVQLYHVVLCGWRAS